MMHGMKKCEMAEPEAQLESDLAKHKPSSKYQAEPQAQLESGMSDKKPAGFVVMMCLLWCVWDDARSAGSVG